ncbi:MAG: glycan-binding surface protein [Bacteroidia bacterium]|nr:glycan-binding surface protein [Bacteroidia bacterium]
MKKYINHLPIMLIAVMITGMIGFSATSCNKETAGDPEIFYVRVTTPAKSDSLLVGAYMGNLVAIVGQNLGNVQEIWFNDQKATLNPAYVTDKSILVSVPSSVPSTVTNKIRLIFRDKSEMLYEFSVNVPGPVLSAIKCEYMPAGELIELTGDFFFEPKVTFPGDIQGVIADFDKTIMHVTVPEGAGSGPITIQTNFGKVNSKFLFRDNNNVILDFDNTKHESWTAPIALAASNPDPAPCSGNYAFFKHTAVGEWMWTNELTLQYWAPRSARGNVPVAKGQVSDLVFRFEANVPIEWKDIRMEIFFAKYDENHGRDDAGVAIARWKPWKKGPYKTNGWETISIPLSEFKYSTSDGNTDEIGSSGIKDLSVLTNVTMMLFGPFETGTTEKTPVLICVDNFRIVSK